MFIVLANMFDIYTYILCYTISYMKTYRILRGICYICSHTSYSITYRIGKCFVYLYIYIHMYVYIYIYIYPNLCARYVYIYIYLQNSNIS